MNDREKLAIAVFCRTFLHIHGFTTERDNDRIHKKIMDWQDENKVGITEAQLDSIEVIYDDNATYDDIKYDRSSNINRCTLSKLLLLVSGWER